jgi:hypothetical protein
VQPGDLFATSTPTTPKQINFAPLHQLPGMRELAIRAAREKYGNDEPPESGTSPEEDALAQIAAIIHRLTERVRNEVNHSG